MRSKPLILLAFGAVLAAFAWGHWHASSRAWKRRAAAGEHVEVLEESPFLVPEGHELVLTSLGSRMGSITDVGVQVDGETVCSATLPTGLIEDRVPIAVVVGPGRRVEVVGGLVRGDDADAWGQLVPQAGWTRGDRDLSATTD